MSNTTVVQPKNQLEYPPGRFVSVYITSKRIHAAKLLDLRAQWPRLYFTARWPIVRDIAAEQSRPARFWMRDNNDDMTRSEVVLCYAEKHDDLNTSIFELGNAWAHNKPIYLVGENEGYKEWQHAEGIQHFDKMETALQRITDRIRYRKTDAEAIMEQMSKLQAKMMDLHEPVQRQLEELRQRFAELAAYRAVIEGKPIG